MTPSECRLIIIDPESLELSAYDGIPHLPTPVVTDSRKATVALEWTVREMEDRYKEMSKVGVRNIDGSDARVAEAIERGEASIARSRPASTSETGEPIFETERSRSTNCLYRRGGGRDGRPRDRHGEDVEGAIQRGSRRWPAPPASTHDGDAAPFGDVITGTIKAASPPASRSGDGKMDSRTILGEQGGEQLLGQGDMLYMAGGGRMTRVHGPFVFDKEVEQVVARLKAQGAPEYLRRHRGERGKRRHRRRPPPARGAASSDGLLRPARSLSARGSQDVDGFVQRHLSVGYNDAASLVERIEKEGVVGAANHVGQAEILIGNGVDRARSRIWMGSMRPHGKLRRPHRPRSPSEPPSGSRLARRPPGLADNLPHPLMFSWPDLSHLNLNMVGSAVSLMSWQRIAIVILVSRLIQKERGMAGKSLSDGGGDRRRRGAQGCSAGGQGDQAQGGTGRRAIPAV